MNAGCLCFKQGTNLIFFKYQCKPFKLANMLETTVACVMIHPLLVSFVGLPICSIMLKPEHQQQQQYSASCLLRSTFKKGATLSMSGSLPGSLLMTIALFFFGDSCGPVARLFSPCGTVQVPSFQGQTSGEVVQVQELVCILACG